MKKSIDTIIDICIALFSIIICGIVSLCFWFYISLLEKESDLYLYIIILSLLICKVFGFKS